MKRACALAAIALLWTGGCFTDATPEGGGTGGDPDCVEGSLSCPCYPNATCDAALVCFEGAEVCVPDNCSPVVAGCPCPADGCGDSLVCEGSFCIEGTAATSGPGSSTSGSTSRTSDPDSSTSRTTGDSSTTGGPPRATSVTLYFSSSATPFSSGAGVVDSRSVAQALCETSMPSVNPSCAQSAAVFSTSDGDSVLDLPTSAGMPFSVPVQNYVGEPVASSFQDLLDNGSATSLLDLGISLADAPGTAPAFFWVGSTSFGENGGNCEGWTRTKGEFSGKGGVPALNMPMFWLSSNDFDCSESAPLLCACWD